MDCHYAANEPTLERFDQPITGLVILRDGSLAIAHEGLALVQKLRPDQQRTLAILLLQRLEEEQAGAGDAATAFAACKVAGHG